VSRLRDFHINKVQPRELASGRGVQQSFRAAGMVMELSPGMLLVNART